MKRALVVAGVCVSCIIAGCSSEPTTEEPVDVGVDDTATTDGAAADTGIDASGGDTSAGDTVATETSTDANGSEVATSDVSVADAAGDPPVVTKTFTEDTTTFLDPERGWMEGGGIGLVDTSSYGSFRTEGYTLAYAKVRLDTYRDKPLDQALLDKLDAGFARVRTAGIKVVLRFVYNDGEVNDATQARIVEHIGQLAPVMTKNVDVIAVVQGGFIGRWGEWHGSSNGLETPAARKAIMEALLKAVPTSRKVQIRTPHFKAELWPEPLADGDALATTDRARTGHHNDCIWASADDEGTYQTPVATWKTWLEQDVRFQPMGGESCKMTDAAKCAPAQAELARFRWSFYNPLWFPEVFANWGTEGCRDDIGKKLGYRLFMDAAKLPTAVRPGGVLPLEISLKNVGYAPPFNARPVRIVLDDGTTRFVATLPMDVRRWAPGAHTISARLRVPAQAKKGTARVELWLPDAATAIEGRPEYSIRLATQGAWDAAKGSNLVSTVTLDDGAPGIVDPAATTFTPL